MPSREITPGWASFNEILALARMKSAMQMKSAFADEICYADEIRFRG